MIKLPSRVERHEECTCKQIAVHSRGHKNFVYSDFVGPDGRWHGLIVEQDDEMIGILQTLVEPSTDWLVRQKEIQDNYLDSAKSEIERETLIKNLRAKRRAGKQLTTDEQAQFLDLLLGV